MKRCLVISLCGLLIWTQYCYAAGKFSARQSTNLSLLSYLISEQTTSLKDFLKFLSLSLTESEMSDTRKILESISPTLEDRMPTLKKTADGFLVGGHKIKIDQANGFFIDKTYVHFKKNESYPQLLNRVAAVIKSSGGHSFFKLIINEAHAQQTSEKTGYQKGVIKHAAMGAFAGGGMGAMIALIAYGAFIGGLAVASGGSVLLVAAVGALAGGTSGGLLARDQSIKSRASVSCGNNSLIIARENLQFVYNFLDKRVQFPATLKNDKDQIIKYIQDAEQNKREALEELYYESCLLNRSAAVNRELKEAHEKIIENRQSTTLGNPKPSAPSKR